MPFGIKSAPVVWQRKMREHMEGLKGVEVIADDFVIVGYGNTPTEWQCSCLLGPLSRAKPQAKQE